ncbi:putative retinol-binding protein 2 [Apostichopus japonicus]|uniref:Putative retinol-binding protein 2 n=1 Tax=Stichopus japonicus TaxID=307972 RepID=A0A2G8JT03_STIJA|nr:putative retinol-binding protein 2 [Apostichopus japonicus]
MPGAALNGKWVFDHGEGMDAVVKALNVPADKIPQDTNSTVDIKVNGDNITITTSFGGKTAESQMVIGQAEPLPNFPDSPEKMSPAHRHGMGQVSHPRSGGKGKLFVRSSEENSR